MQNITRHVPMLAVVLALMLAPAAAQQTASPGAAASGAPDAHLAVATVRINDSLRASKIIGATVANDHNESIGTVDDLMLVDQDKVAFAVISVGGFLGIGSKLVAVPYGQLQRGSSNRLVWPGATKQSLNDMPNFTYGG